MLSSVVLGVLLSGGGSPIDLDGSLFIQATIFFVTFFILKGILFRPVLELFDRREAAVAGARDEAQRMESDAESKRNHFEGELRKVRSTANEDRERLRGEAQKLARQLTDDARKRGNDKLGQAKSRMEVDADKARNEARAQVPDLARQIAGKLLDRNVNG